MKYRAKSLIGIALLSTVIGVGFNLLTIPSNISFAQDSGKVFELRTYKATPGNLLNLQARFRDHTLAIFEKHGMTNVAYWTPTDPELSGDTLVYLLAHDSREAADAAWRAFGQDPQWQAVSEASNANGPILASVERMWLTTLDFSPMQ